MRSIRVTIDWSTVIPAFAFLVVSTGLVGSLAIGGMAAQAVTAGAPVAVAAITAPAIH